MANYSTDSDLQNIEKNILDYLPSGDTDFNRFHAIAKDKIDAMIRAKGVDPDDTDWTIDDKDNQIKRASCFYVLSLIFTETITNPDDLQSIKAEKYRQEFEATMGTLLITLVNASGDEKETNLSGGYIQRG